MPPTRSTISSTGSDVSVSTLPASSRVRSAHRAVRAPARTLREHHDEVRRLHADGDLTASIRLLRRLIAAAPDVDRLRRDLVVLLRCAGDHFAADRLAVQLDPTDVEAWSRQARHARRTRDVELFIETSLGWGAAVPADPVAGHFADIARSLRDGAAHERASDAYVRSLFDPYAERFDDHLAHLAYRGPEVVAGLITDLVADGDLGVDASVADLGCGTGLVGQCLRANSVGRADTDAAWHGRLVGNDLAPRMLERTSDRRVGGRPVYDEVAEADFATFLAARPAEFDAVVAADALIYVGDLRPVFTAAATSLRPGGWLIATLERATSDRASAAGFAPDLTGRYLHDDAWLHAALVDAGFELIVVEHLSVRVEVNRPVPGSVVVARLPTEAPAQRPTSVFA